MFENQHKSLIDTRATRGIWCIAWRETWSMTGSAWPSPSPYCPPASRVSCTSWLSSWGFAWSPSPSPPCMVGPDHGHRFTLMGVKFAELLNAILLNRNIRNIFGFCFTDSSEMRSPGSGLVEFLVPTCIVSWIFIRI